MKIFYASNTCKILSCIVFVLLGLNVQTQTVHIIPNPQDHTVYTSAFNSDFPQIYKNNLIVATTNSLAVFELAKYDGNVLTVIPNPPNTYPHIDVYAIYPQTIIFQDKLYCIFLDSDSLYHLAQYDNNSIKIIANQNGYQLNPDAGFTNYLGKLYMEYTNTSTSLNQLAVFDGTKISFISNPDVKGSVVNHSPFTVYQNKLVFYYDSTNTTDRSQLAFYDGTSFTFVSNPQNIYGVTGSFITYHNNLFFQGLTISRLYVLMKYNGSNLQALPNPNYGSVADYAANTVNHKPWVPFVDSVHNQLCFLYTNLDSLKVHLCSYNDTLETVIPNPISYGFTELYPLTFPITFKNRLYLHCSLNMLEYTGKTLIVLPNLDQFYANYGPSIIYKNNLIAVQSSSCCPYMCEVQSDTFKIIPNTLGYLDYSIIFNNKLYSYYYVSGLGENLGYLDSGAILANSLFKLDARVQNGNTVLNWQAQNNGDIAYFNIQRSTDGVNFMTINKTQTTNNIITAESYTYTDHAVDQLNVSRLYYRLQSVDKNGIGNYSNIVTTSILKRLTFSVSPNPVKNVINITSSSACHAEIVITGVNGKTLYSSNHDFIIGEKLTVPLASLANQTLFITIITNSGNQKFKVVKD